MTPPEGDPDDTTLDPEDWIEVRRLGHELLDDSDELNREIVMRVQERGIAVPSAAEIDGRLCIRVNITNHRTRREDLEIFLAAIEKIRSEIVEEAIA